MNAAQGPTRQIGSRTVGGAGHPAFITGEIGINHNGDIENATKLIKIAAEAGCDAVKFQKRTPEICTPRDQWDVMRDTPPWGRMPYIEYRHKVEFGEDGYAEIAKTCAEHGIEWFASPWDEPSVDFLEKFDVPAHKVASASLTDDGLLKKLAGTGKTIILSTGMSTMEQIEHAVETVGTQNLILAHATSTYPAQAEELNLRMINTLAAKYPPEVPIGYSGHETGLQTSLAAVVLGGLLPGAAHHPGPCHVGAPTRPPRSSRAGWSGWSAISGWWRRPWVTGVKKVYDSELGPMKKLRRFQGEQQS